MTKSPSATILMIADERLLIQMQEHISVILVEEYGHFMNATLL